MESVSQFSGICGSEKGGNPPLMLSPSFKVSETVMVSIPKPITITDTTNTATNDEGTACVSFGTLHIMTIVNRVSPSITHIAEPSNSMSVPF